MDVLQRPTWQLFRLTKQHVTARAVIFTHCPGWEVRLFIGAQNVVVQSQVCRTQEEVLATDEKWKAALNEKGWA